MPMPLEAVPHMRAYKDFMESSKAELALGDRQPVGREGSRFVEYNSKQGAEVLVQSDYKPWLFWNSRSFTCIWLLRARW